MRRLYTYIILAATLLFSAASCTVRDITPNAVDENGSFIELSVVATDLEMTKADEDGVNKLNENLIKTVDYFVYTSVRAENDKAFIHGRVTESETKQNSETIRINIDETVFNTQLMPRNTADTCAVYVIVNLPSGIQLPEVTSIGNLRKMVVEMDTKVSPQNSFVMAGLGNVTLTSRMSKTVASGSVNVERIAAKHTLAIFVEESYPDNEGKTWYTHPEGMRVLLVNAVKNSTLSGNFADNTEPEIDTFTGSNLSADGRLCTSQTLDNQTYYALDPFYSYPNEWEFNSETEPYFLVELPVSEDTEGASQYRGCYYKVLLKDNKLESNTWNHINLVLGILGSFSPKAPTVEAKDISYYVFNWRNALKNATQSEHDVEAAIREARYLVVPEPDRIVDNLESISISFSSSHPCKIVSAEAWHTVWNGSNFIKENVASDTVKGWFTVNNADHIVEFSHTLVNDISSNKLDISAYNITVVLEHSDNSNFKETITIVQSPAIVVTPELNTANSNNDTGRGTRGDVYVNGQDRKAAHRTDGEWGGYDENCGNYNSVGYIRTNGSGDGNGSEYMYVIETKVIPEGTDYIIGDPRSLVPNKVTAPMTDASDRAGKTYDIFDYSNSEVDSAVGNGKLWGDDRQPGLSNAPALFVEDGDGHYVDGDGTDTRKMRYYYPTLTTKESEKYIAPKFRIASRFNSMGSTGPSWYDLVRRCATYQESGYPAGRWRLPTKSEVSYIYALQEKGLIPEIFVHGAAGSETQGYYCATDTFSFEEGADKLSFTDEIYKLTRSMRCVYDEWYWEQTDDKVNGNYMNAPQITVKGRLPADKFNVFTWGDMPRKGAQDLPKATKLVMGTVTCGERGRDYLDFSWDAVANAKGYEVSTSASGSFTSIGNNTSYRLTNLTEGTSYTLYVRAAGNGYDYATSDASTCTAATLKKVKKVLWTNPGYGAATNKYQHTEQQPAYRFGSPQAESPYDCMRIFSADEWAIIKGQTFYAEIGSSSFEFRLMTGWWEGSGETFTQSSNSTRIDNNTYYVEINVRTYNSTLYNNLDTHDLCFYGTNVKVNSIYYYTYE